jgi:hypothetical protein
MTRAQILEAIRLMQNVERIEVLEFTLRLMREDISSDENRAKKILSLAAAAEMMRDFYLEGSELTEFSDRSQDDFYEYENYA